jgi:hypothetical protein
MVFHFFVCSHGFGHIKRDLGIAASLIRSGSVAEIWFHVNEDHFENFRNFISNWVPELKIEKLKFEFDSMTLAPDFINAENYNLLKYNQWLGDLKELNIETSHIILSDNLAGILEAYPEAILIGSFLWTDISKLREYPKLAEILTSEVTLLESVKPRMLGIMHFGMPGTVKRTQFIEFPWFCKRPFPDIENEDKSKVLQGTNILFTGGGTGTIKGILSGLIMKIAGMVDFNAFVDNGLLKETMEGKNILPFNYIEQSYFELDFIIGRPGVGTMTDAVKYCVPLLMIYENDNDEMVHNATVFQGYGLGLDINGYVLSNPMNITGLSELLKDRKLKNKLKSALMGQPTNGLDLVADYLVKLRN